MTETTDHLEAVFLDPGVHVVPGFVPSVYPACVTCSRAWALHRERGAWAWYPDCTHKRAKCKLVSS